MSNKQLSVLVVAILVGASIIAFSSRSSDASSPRLSRADAAQKEHDESEECLEYRIKYYMNDIDVLDGKPDKSAEIERLRIASGCTHSNTYEMLERIYRRRNNR